jgi:2-oxoisovalerate dehydrogenase E1 component
MPKSLYIDPVAVRQPGKIHFEDIPVCQYNKTIKQEMEEGNYTKEDLIRIYRDMAICREFEHMLTQIKTQANYNGIETTYPGPAHLSYGQEASCVGEAYLLNREDITFGSHRSHSEILSKGLSCIQKLSDKELLDTMESFLGGKTLAAVRKFADTTDVKELAIRFLLYGTVAEIFARENGFHHGMGGSMHAFFLPFGIYPNNAIVGGSAPIATGAALYQKNNDKKGVVVCNIGDASLGCGPVYEALNFSAMDQYNTLWEEGRKGGLPIIYNVFDNFYGMGGQTYGETMAYGMPARLGAGITASEMHAERVDGWNPLAVIDAYKRKMALIKNNEGPVLLDVVTYRLVGHSTSDQNAYRSKEEIEDWRSHDPIIKFREALVEAGVESDEFFGKLLQDTSDRMTMICRAADDKQISPYVDFDKNPDYLANLMFSNQTVRSMDTKAPIRVTGPKESCKRYADHRQEGTLCLRQGPARRSPRTRSTIPRRRLRALIDKFYEDPTLVAYGEENRDWGGAFAVYRGLTEALPYHRLFNSPIAEAAIVGSAVGYAMCGGRVVVELMYCDFLGRAGDEVFNQLPSGRPCRPASSRCRHHPRLGRFQVRRPALAGLDLAVRADPRPEGRLPGHPVRRQGHHAGGSQRHRSLRHLRVAENLRQGRRVPQGRRAR